LGLANYYRRYIAIFSTVAAPLTNTRLGQRKQLDRGKLQESAFHDVKRAYTTAPVLKIADPALDYVVTTDSSDVGIGGVLEQEYDDGLHPVAYASRKLNSAEQNYPTHDPELLAIIYAVREWRTYLHGARFRIRCDLHQFSSWKPSPNFQKDKPDGWMLWPNLTTQSNTAKENGTFSVTPCPGRQTSLRRNYSPGSKMSGKRLMKISVSAAKVLLVSRSIIS
jgi:RNase H-like domain found in reverse transcriptase